MHGAIDRGAGALQDAGDAKRLIVVPRKADIAGAVGEDDRVVEPIAEASATSAPSTASKRSSNPSPRAKLSPRSRAIAIVLEIARVVPSTRKPRWESPSEIGTVQATFGCAAIS